MNHSHGECRRRARVSVVAGESGGSRCSVHGQEEDGEWMVATTFRCAITEVSAEFF